MPFLNEGRNYLKTGAGAAAEAAAKTYLSRNFSRTLSYLPRWILGKAVGSIVGSAAGIILSSSNTIVSGSEERRMLQEARNRIQEARNLAARKVRTEPLPLETPPISTSSTQSSTLYYKVRSGERLWNMAPRFGYDDAKRFINDFRVLNPAVDPNRIKAGNRYNIPFNQGDGRRPSGGMQTLSVHPSTVAQMGALDSISYRVRSGERLWNMAPRFGYDNPRHFVNEFRRMNPGINPNLIIAGRSYTMPLSQPSAPQPGSLRWMGQGLR